MKKRKLRKYERQSLGLAGWTDINYRAAMIERALLAVFKQGARYGRKKRAVRRARDNG